MRLVVHDYAGYAFTIQLARHLAHLGHDVVYAYCAEFVAPHPHGPLQREANDSSRLTILAVSAGTALKKYSLLSRWRYDRQYGRALVRAIKAVHPDVVFSADTPLGSQVILQNSIACIGTRSVLWWQDIYSHAINSVVRKKLGAWAGSIISRHYGRVEARLLTAADAVVAISPAFLEEAAKLGATISQAHVVPNWGPLSDIPTKNKDNPWSRAHGLHNRKVVLYSGTLGYKHNPDLLLHLARGLSESGSDAVVVVVSQGVGAEYLHSQILKWDLDNLVVMNYQPYEAIPDLLGSANVLIALLEADAAKFSVPSKILSYLCAGRRVVAALPRDNLAGRVIREAQAGSVVDPDDVAGFVKNVVAELVNSHQDPYCPDARQYAETYFDIERISMRFESIASATFESPVSTVSS